MSLSPADGQAPRGVSARSLLFRGVAARAGCIVRLACAASALVIASSACLGVNVVLKYDYDASQFFGAGNPSGATAGGQAKAALEAAASFFSGILNDTLSSIQTPPPFASGGGSVVWHWTASFSNPGGNGGVSLTDLTIPADEYRIYVGAKNLDGSTLGVGGPGGASTSVNGSYLPSDSATVTQINNNFQSSVYDRGEATGFAAWGGALAFDVDAAAWHYNHLTSPSAGESDFYSVALHEMAHVLGFGASDEWFNFASGALFTGPAAAAEYGSLPPLEPPNPTRSHWQSSTLSRVYGTNVTQEAAMDPELTTGTRKYFTRLDAAALTDIGWTVAPPPNPADFNDDAFVNGDDLIMWKQAFAATSAADADGDGDSDGLDFLIWQRQRGASAIAAAAGVPEPGGGVLCAVAVAAVAARLRRSTSRRSFGEVPLL